MSQPLKVCFVGAEGSGKTALITRIIFDEFDESYAPTVEDSFSHSLLIGIVEHNFDILDIGGSDSWKSEHPRWFSWPDAFVLIYNVADEESFLQLKYFREEIVRVQKERKIPIDRVPFLLIGTGADRPCKVPGENARKIAELLNCPFFETSSKSPEVVKNSSKYPISPAEILSQLVQQQSKKKTLKDLDELVHSPQEKKSNRVPKKLQKTAQSNSTTRITAHAVNGPAMSLLQELTEKWSKPVDKLPVYIDFPRLATKISVEIVAPPPPGTKVMVTTGSPLLKHDSSPSLPPVSNPVTILQKSNSVKDDSSSPKSGGLLPFLSPKGSRASAVVESSTKSKDDMSANPKRPISAKLSKKEIKEMKEEERKREKLEKQKQKEEKKKKEEEEKKKKKEEKKGLSNFDLFEIGHRVFVPTEPELGKGTVRYKGQVKQKSGYWIGIELDSPKGKHNGSSNGTTYFSCPNNHGVIVKAHLVALVFKKIGNEQFKGGKIRSNLGEDWVFDAKTGTLSCPGLKYEDKEILYEWDGTIFKAKNDSAALGAAQWNGEYAVWYKKEWMIYRTSKREEFIKYSWDEKSHRFVPVDKPHLAAWETKVGALSCVPPKPEANVNYCYWSYHPEEVHSVIPLMIQMLRYSRLGLSVDIDVVKDKPSKDEKIDSTSTSSQLSPASHTPSTTTPNPNPNPTPTSTTLSPPTTTVPVRAVSPQPLIKVTEPPSAPANNNNNSMFDEESKSSFAPVGPSKTADSAPVPTGGALFKLNIHIVHNWKLRVPISELATVKQLMNEISKRASARLVALEDQFNQNQKGIEINLSKLYKAVEHGDQENADEAAGICRLLVEEISARIQDGRAMSYTQPLDLQHQIQDACSDLEEVQRSLVKTTIDALRNKDFRNVALYHLLESISEVKNISALISVRINQVKVLDLKYGDAFLDPLDQVGQVLDSESELHAVVEKTEEQVRKAELQQKREEEEVERAKKLAILEAEKQKKEEEELDKKWDALFDAIETGEIDKIDQKLATPTSPVNPPSTSTLSAPSSPQKSSENKEAPVEVVNFLPSNNGDKKVPLAETMKRVLCELAEKLGEKQELDAIQQQFGTFIKTGGDTSRQMAKFLQHVLKDNSKLTKVLKAINQSIIATPFVKLKQVFHDGIPFEDQAGTWKILVSICPNHFVLVTHQKTGSSKFLPPKGGFQFTWELQMKFPWTLDIMSSASLKVLGSEFQDGIAPEIKKEVQKVLTSF